MSRLHALSLLLLISCASSAHEDQAAPRAWPARIAPPRAPSGDAREVPADLEGLVGYALEHNPDLRAAHRSFEAALERSGEVGNR